ncbi:MAG: dihydrolipoyl dehydrogenase [bacterium]
MPDKHYEAVVIGAGPGGYAAAIRLGQLGKKTLIIEKEAIGGTCLNFGCVPSKALISAADLYHKLDHSDAMGISVKEKAIDFEKTQQWKGEVVGRLTGGVAQLLKGNEVDTLEGTARFKDAHSVLVETGEGEEEVTFDRAVIATGSRPFFLEGFEPDGEVVVGSRGALDFAEVPEKLLVIGGGYIGLELGIAYAKLGTGVTVVEMMDTLLPGSPKRLAKMVERSCKKLEMDIHLKTKAKGLERSGEKAVLTAEDREGEEKTFEADRVLVTIGRKPNTEGLDLEAAGLETDEKGFLSVDPQRRTEVEHIFAIGDVAGEPMLAHKAAKEGVVAAEVIAGEPAEYDYRAVPAVIFTEPEIAYVGLGKEEAEEGGYEVVTGRFPFQANGRALALDETDGWVQVIGDGESGMLLGVQIVGPGAADLISEACLALEMGARMEDVGYTMHPHPTLGEAVMEAAEGALGKAIHQLNR